MEKEMFRKKQVHRFIDSVIMTTNKFINLENKKEQSVETYNNMLKLKEEAELLKKKLIGSV